MNQMRFVMRAMVIFGLVLFTLARFFAGWLILLLLLAPWLAGLWREAGWTVHVLGRPRG